MSLFGEIRAASAEVMRRAKQVHLDEAALSVLAGELARERPPLPGLDPAHDALPDREATLAYVVTLDAVNFGSGWFPELRKLPGLSGYRTVATRLRERFAREGPLPAQELRGLDAGACAALFGQQGNPGVAELMELFARALRELGAFLEEGYGGRFGGPVEEAGGNAGRLVGILARMPLYRDVARYEELAVPFYKRAQLTCSDLALAFGGEGPGAFRDLDELTCFADNLVPHVLHRAGVLRYDPGLRARIDAGELLAPGSPEEVEIRAGGVHGVERLAGACAERDYRVPAHALDHLLWGRGQSPESKAVPRHRTRCTFY